MQYESCAGVIKTTVEGHGEKNRCFRPSMHLPAPFLAIDLTHIDDLSMTLDNDGSVVMECAAKSHDFKFLDRSTVATQCRGS